MAALDGSWAFWGTVYANGKEKRERGTYTWMNFASDGSGAQGVTWHEVPFSYTIEGKNVVTTDPSWKTVRVDSVTSEELRMFWYELSVTVIYKRKT